MFPKLKKKEGKKFVPVVGILYLFVFLFLFISFDFYSSCRYNGEFNTVKLAKVLIFYLRIGRQLSFEEGVVFHPSTVVWAGYTWSARN